MPLVMLLILRWRMTKNLKVLSVTFVLAMWQCFTYLLYAGLHPAAGPCRDGRCWSMKSILDFKTSQHNVSHIDIQQIIWWYTLRQSPVESFECQRNMNFSNKLNKFTSLKQVYKFKCSLILLWSYVRAPKCSADNQGLDIWFPSMSLCTEISTFAWTFANHNQTISFL